MFALTQTVGSHFPARISVQPGEAYTEEGMRNSTILIAAVLLGGHVRARRLLPLRSQSGQFELC